MSTDNTFYQRLAKVDLHRYDESWERDALDVLPQIYGSPRSLIQSLQGEIKIKPHHQVLDLRRAPDFHVWHLPGSINLPLGSIGAHIASPFANAAILEAQWVELEQIFNDDRLISDLRGAHILVVCYDGDTARVATSVLRARGLEADSVRGGYSALREYGIGGASSVSASTRSTEIKLPAAAMVSVKTVSVD